MAGALLEAELGAVVTEAGFRDFEITWRAPVFDGARDGYIFKRGPRGNGYYLDAQRKQQ